MLEFLADQFNTANREADYCTTLLKLFDLYCQQGNYMKACDALDRAAEIDAYEPGHQKRLAALKGKIDQNRYEVIASRFGATHAQQCRGEDAGSRNIAGLDAAGRNSGAVRHAQQSP